MTTSETTVLESELAAMDDDGLVRVYDGLEVDDPRVDVTAGEMERRNIDA